MYSNHYKKFSFLIILLMNILNIQSLDQCTLDPSFTDGINGAGRVITALIPGGQNYGEAVLLQPGNKILVAGTSNNQFSIIQYNDNGSIDTTFGTNGIVITPILSSSQAFTAASLPGGQFVVGGTANDGVNTYFALAKYDALGNLDATFGTGGIVTTLFTPGLPPPGIDIGSVIRSIAIQPDGKIVASGSTLGDFITSFALFATARYLPDGSLDTTFNPGGTVPGTLTTSIEVISLGMSVIVQPDLKIVVGGTSQSNLMMPNNTFTLVRYLSDGSLDTSFGTNGIVETAFDSSSAIFGLAQTSTSIIAVGLANIQLNDVPEIIGGSIALAKYNIIDGSLDTTFGTNGIVITSIGSNLSFAKAVALQSDGKIVIVGLTNGTFPASAALPYQQLSRGNLLVARYNPNGSIDTTFANMGRIITSLVGPAISTDVVIQPDGKIVASGLVRTSNTTASFATVRYLCDLTTFVTIDFPPNNKVVNNSMPTITGTMEVGNTIVTVSIDGGTPQNATIINSLGGTWSFTPSTTLAEGPHTVQAFTQDPFGNTASSSIINFTIDTSTFITINSPSNGSITNNNQPTIIGNMEVGNTIVTVSIDGGTPQNAMIDSSMGVWAFVVNTPLSDGVHTIEAITEDPSSNTASQTISFTVDTIAPILIISSPSNDSIINNNQPTIIGFSEPGLIVQVSIDGTSIGSASVDSNGIWSINVPSPLSDGQHTIFATTQDAAGNIANDTSVFTVDTIKPTITISFPMNGTITNNNQPTIIGLTEPGLKVFVSIDGNNIGSTVANTFGAWSINTPSPLSNGTHVIFATTQDAAGNTSIATSIFTIIQPAPNIKITSPKNGATLTTQRIIISGITIPNKRVRIFIDNKLIGSVVSNASGRWSIQSPFLSFGSHVITAIIRSAAGMVSDSVIVSIINCVSPSDSLSNAIRAKYL